jgi:hypothetical protein
MNSEIQIVDRGRGLQLSTNRITVWPQGVYCLPEEFWQWLAWI